MHLGPLDYVFLACVALSALYLAGDTGVRQNDPEKKLIDRLPKAIRSPKWNYLPLILMLVAGLILVVRSVGLVGSNEQPTQSGGTSSQPIVVSQPEKLPLAPSERERLSNVIYQLSEILRKEGQPVAANATGLANLRRSMQPVDFLQKLAAVQQSHNQFRTDLFEKFIPENQCYNHEIFQMLQDSTPVNEFARQLSEFSIIVNQTNGIDAGKAENIASIATSRFVKATERFRSWMTRADERINAMRASLR